MLLCRVKSLLWESAVDLPGDVALEASDDLPFREALCCAAFDVGPSRVVATKSGDHHEIER